MGDTWWVIIICPCVNVFSIMGGVTEADVGFPTIDTSEQRERDITTGLFGLSNEIIRIIFNTTVDIRYRFFPIKSAFRRFFLHRQR
jgi:hypothetical protein